MIRANQRHSAHCENWRRSLKERGLKPVSFIIERTDESSLNDREVFWIRHFRELGCDLTNLTDGADGYHLSQAHRDKLIKANIGRVCKAETLAKISVANQGKKRTFEQIEKMRQSKLGKKASEETKQKMSNSRKGKALSEAHKLALASSWAEHHTSDTLEKIAASKRGKERDYETKLKISQKLKGKPWSEARRKAQSTLKISDLSPLHPSIDQPA